MDDHTTDERLDAIEDELQALRAMIEEALKRLEDDSEASSTPS